MTSDADSHVPVLIVGGSLVGLSASLFLGRLGVRHLLVERHTATSHHPRGRGNNVRTMELYRTAGIEPRIRAAARHLAGNQGILQADTLWGAEREWLYREIDPGGELTRISPSSWCLCSQSDLEPVLLTVARELGADIRFGTELESFEQDPDGVTAVVREPGSGRSRTVRARYLVAADGPRSPVRERLGIGSSGRGELFHNISVTFRTKGLADAVGDRRFIVCYLRNPEGSGALLPVDNAQAWVFHAPWRPGAGERPEDFTDERCAALIRAATGVTDLELEITGKAPWHAAERVADGYGRGRVFLAGDAAHEMPPTGALGANTGIQDAHNLAWKLAAVLQGWAGPQLLRSYETERRPVALATAGQATARSAEQRHPGYEATPGTARQPDALAAVLGYRYRSGAVYGAGPEQSASPQESAVPERFRAGAEPGTRAPHLWLDRDGVRLSTLDLYERGPVLLTGPAGRAWHDTGLRAAAALGVPLHCHQVGDGVGQDSALSSEEGTHWAQEHGVDEDGAVLVRPDGFVAWRATAAHDRPLQVLTDVLETVLGRA